MTNEEVKAILERFGAKGDALTWNVQGSRVIYHRVLEGIARNNGIEFDPPNILRAERDEAVITVTGRRHKAGEASKMEWSIGEALLNVNYKVSGKQQAYVYAMAEKRGKDRVILKLIGLHGEVYSEVEADDFAGQDDGAGSDAASDEHKAAASVVWNAIKACRTWPQIEAHMKTDAVQETLQKLPEAMSKEVRGFAWESMKKLGFRKGAKADPPQVQQQTATSRPQSPPATEEGFDERAALATIKDELETAQSESDVEEIRSIHVDEREQMTRSGRETFEHYFEQALDRLEPEEDRPGPGYDPNTPDAPGFIEPGGPVAPVEEDQDQEPAPAGAADDGEGDRRPIPPMPEAFRIPDEFSGFSGFRRWVHTAVLATTTEELCDLLERAYGAGVDRWQADGRAQHVKPEEMKALADLVERKFGEFDGQGELAAPPEVKREAPPAGPNKVDTFDTLLTGALSKATSHADLKAWWFAKGTRDMRGASGADQATLQRWKTATQKRLGDLKQEGK